MKKGTKITITGDRGKRMDVVKEVTYIKPCSFNDADEIFPALVRMANGRSAQFTGGKLFNYDTTLLINCLYTIND